MHNVMTIVFTNLYISTPPRLECVNVCTFFLFVDHQPSKVEEIKEETNEEHREEMMYKQIIQSTCCTLPAQWEAPAHQASKCNFTHM